MAMDLRFHISGTGAYLPERVVTAAELAASIADPLATAEWIVERTGIAERRFAAPEDSTSDLGARACQSALENAGVDVSDVDMLVLATSSPDWIQPATASKVHGLLGMRAGSGAMDLNVVCSGFIYALHTAAALLA